MSFKIWLENQNFSGKTSWSSEGLTRKGINSNDFARQKKAELFEMTGVPWSAYTAGGKLNFLPYLNSKDVVAQSNADYEKIITEYLIQAKGIDRYRTYLDIHQNTGIPLKELMPVAKDMLDNLRAAATVDRMGNNVAMKLR